MKSVSRFAVNVLLSIRCWAVVLMYDEGSYCWRSTESWQFHRKTDFVALPLEKTCDIWLCLHECECNSNNNGNFSRWQLVETALKKILTLMKLLDHDPFCFKDKIIFVYVFHVLWLHSVLATFLAGWSFTNFAEKSPSCISNSSSLRTFS